MRIFVAIKTLKSMEDNFVINLGRQLGSGGRDIGIALAKRLNIDFYDKELLDLAAEQSGLCKEFFEKADEQAQNKILGAFYSMRIPFITESALPAANCLSYDALFKVQSDVIRKLAAEKSCLFVGRCADYILREHPRCANIFISADKEMRVARLCESNNITNSEAEELIARTDKRRAEYYNYYSYKTWGAAASYHLCINSSVLGIDKTVDYLEQFVRDKLDIRR